MKKITIFELLIIVISLCVISYYFYISFSTGFSDNIIEYKQDKLQNIRILSALIRKDLNMYTSGFNPGNANYSFYIFSGKERPFFSERLIQYTIEDSIFIRKENAEITHKIFYISDFNIHKKDNLFYIFAGNNQYSIEIIEHFSEKRPVEEF